MQESHSILFVGGGAMGGSLMRGLLDKGTCAPSQMEVIEPVVGLRAALARDYGVGVHADPSTVAPDKSAIVLCVKPQAFPQAGPPLGALLTESALLISIMAGVDLSQLARVTRHKRIVRAMPNTPAQVLAGMTVWKATAQVDAAQRRMVGALFAAVGAQMETDDETDLDRATALNGSGPGYLYLIVEALIDAGVHIGFSRDQAAQLVRETFWGSAQLMKTHPATHPAELRNRVTSPAGTTAAGLHTLEKAGLRAALVDAVTAAYERSRALGT